MKSAKFFSIFLASLRSSLGTLKPKWPPYLKVLDIDDYGENRGV